MRMKYTKTQILRNTRETYEIPNEYYIELLGNTVDCIWHYDIGRQCFIYISPSVYSLRGLTAEEALAEKLEDCFTQESIKKIMHSGMKRYLKFLSGDRRDNIVCETDDYSQYCSDGSIKTFEISTRLILNDDKKSASIIGISRDITSRKTYEKKLLNRLDLKAELLHELNPAAKETDSNTRIYFFGKLSVYGPYQKTHLKWRTRKTEELFAYFLSRKNFIVSKSEIIEDLWPDADIDKAATYLHTTIYNMKKDLSSAGIEVMIKYKNDCYTFILSSHYSDTSEFTDILDNSVISLDYIDDITLMSLERAVTIYKNDYLSMSGYMWAFDEISKYRDQYYSIALSLSQYYFLRHNYESAKRILLGLLKKDNFNESAHELLLKIYLQNNDYKSFIFQYEQFEELLIKELGIRPAKSIQALYKNFNSYTNDN